MPTSIQGRRSRQKQLRGNAYAHPLASIGSPPQRALSMGLLSPRTPYLFWKLARPASSITDGLSYLWRRVGAGAPRRHGFPRCSRAYGGVLSSRQSAPIAGPRLEEHHWTVLYTACRSQLGALGLEGAAAALTSTNWSLALALSEGVRCETDDYCHCAIHRQSLGQSNFHAELSLWITSPGPVAKHRAGHRSLSGSAQ